MRHTTLNPTGTQHKTAKRDDLHGGRSVKTGHATGEKADRTRVTVTCNREMADAKRNRGRAVHPIWSKSDRFVGVGRRGQRSRTLRWSCGDCWLTDLELSPDRRQCLAVDRAPSSQPEAEELRGEADAPGEPADAVRADGRGEGVTLRPLGIARPWGVDGEAVAGCGFGEHGGRSWGQ